MDERNISYGIGLTTGALFVFILLLGIVLGSRYDLWLLNASMEVESYDRVSDISCNSYSMGWEYSCGGKAYLKKFNGTVVIGRVYVFQPSWRNSSLVIHRAIDCETADCSVVIFKGDANKVVDAPVLKEEILYEVVRVDYRK